MTIDLQQLRPSDRYGAYAVIRNVLPLFVLSAMARALVARHALPSLGSIRFGRSLR